MNRQRNNPQPKPTSITRPAADIQWRFSIQSRRAQRVIAAHSMAPIEPAIISIHCIPAYLATPGRKSSLNLLIGELAGSGVVASICHVFRQGSLGRPFKSAQPGRNQFAINPSFARPCASFPQFK